MTEDTEIIDWLESRHTLHWSVEALYVVDGYQVELTRDGSTVHGPYWGLSLRRAYMNAMRNAPDIPAVG